MYNLNDYSLINKPILNFLNKRNVKYNIFSASEIRLARSYYYEIDIEYGTYNYYYEIIIPDTHKNLIKGIVKSIGYRNDFVLNIEITYFDDYIVISIVNYNG